MNRKQTTMFSAGGVVLFVLLLLMPTLFAQDDSSDMAEIDPQEVVITLERTACFGTCPVYTLTIYADGTVEYVGENHVEVEGEQTGDIGLEGVIRLLAEFVKAGFFQLEDAYDYRYVTDMPSTITSITIGDVTKEVYRYAGDSNAPIELVELENAIDEITNSAQWTGVEPQPVDQVGMANPASENCVANGGTSEIRTDDDGNQYGVCVFDDGSECEEWAFFNGECSPGDSSSDAPIGMANPASVYCAEQGGTSEIRTDDDGNQYGVCVFDDGSECDEWAFFRGDCSPGDSADSEAQSDDGMEIANPASEYCVAQGGTSEIRTDDDGNQYGVCVFDDGSECDEWAYYRDECSPGDSLESDD